MTEAPLAEDTAARVGVVAGPKGMEVLEGAIVHAAGAAGTEHGGNPRILLDHARHHVVEGKVVVDEQVGLVVRRQVSRAGLGDVAVGVPFDVADAWIRAERIVYDFPGKLAHFRAAEVEVELVAAQFQFAVGLADGPFGMLLEEIAHRVDHFRLEPNAPIDSAPFCFRREVGESVRELIGVDLPIAEAGLVIVARVAVAEPTIVEQKGFGANLFGAVEQRDDGRLVEVETGGFPVIEQDGTGLGGVANPVTAGPAMEIAADLAFALVAPGP